MDGMDTWYRHDKGSFPVPADCDPIGMLRSTERGEMMAFSAVHQMVLKVGLIDSLWGQ